jgi:hypothetical protein
MTTTYAWKISNMTSYPQAEGETNVVFQVDWVCNANDGANAATSAGSVEVTYTAGTPYTPYADLTQEQVWGWVNPQIDRPEIESNLQVLIDAQKTPATITLPIPWSN